MSNAVLLAVLDTLLPGDTGDPPLPSASNAALPMGELMPLGALVIAALPQNFTDLSAPDRVAALHAVDAAQPGAFRALVTAALAAYYDSPSVLAALGWRSAPPQPHGHVVPPADAETWRKLETVRSRGQIWRG
jgi:hypothetical protein